MNGEQTTAMKSALEQELAATMQQDARDALIAQAVRSAPMAVLPADFAAQVAGKLTNKTEDTSAELAFAVALLVLLSLSGLWYAGISVVETYGTALKSNLPLILTLLAIVAMVQGWELLKKAAGQRNQTPMLL